MLIVFIVINQALYKVPVHSRIVVQSEDVLPTGLGVYRGWFPLQILGLPC